MDDNDRAAESEEHDRQLAQRRHADSQRKVEPRDDCEECGDDLLEHRKPYGICVDCQSDRELRDRHIRRE